ncbi:cytochrome P450 monooxygenase [Colletotrichum costaricense]|uniref:Cytochrome P450 monooxygenase n=1 Tax=Colletotrichum costaricense TaxID=1209916 RepID=A0AAJ0DWG5_9PEZI|nr:cytochrome P450 monooxygenase [Colletotrichum costaricense]KAK1517643.1 cytochrome P450 monooxygenase [Colletotrichum costaricense]
MNLAYTEMRSVLSRINWHSEMRLSSENRRWIELQEARVVWEKPASKMCCHLGNRLRQKPRRHFLGGV